MTSQSPSTVWRFICFLRRYIWWKICWVTYWTENNSCFQNFIRHLCSSLLLSEVVRLAGASFTKFMKKIKLYKRTWNLLRNWPQTCYVQEIESKVFPIALAIFDPTICAAIRRHFPEQNDSADFLDLFYVWWTISNSKEARNTRNLLGSAAIQNDEKPQFLRDLASWIEQWDELKCLSTEKLTLSGKTSSSNKLSLRCQAA